MFSGLLTSSRVDSDAVKVIIEAATLGGEVAMWDRLNECQCIAIGDSYLWKTASLCKHFNPWHEPVA
jgi:hypothetical protein